MTPRRLLTQMNVLATVLLLLSLFRVGVWAYVSLDDALDAMYVDASVVPTVSDTINNYQSGSNRVKRSVDVNGNEIGGGGAMVVPKGYDTEADFAQRRLNDRYYTFVPDLDKPRPQYGKGPMYRPLKKLPRLVPPWPLGIFVRDRIRPFPNNTILIISPLFLIPFTPFGVFELRLPFGFSLNYLSERLNGVTPSGLRSLETDQHDLYGFLEGILTDTYALDGRQCVQRLVCDLAHTPLKERSLMGEILHSLIEPRGGNSKQLDDYLEAEVQGHRHGGCRQAFPRCPISINNMIYDAQWKT